MMSILQTVLFFQELKKNNNSYLMISADVIFI